MNSMQNWECSTCSKTFTAKGFLKQHVVTHDPNAKVKCAICGKISKNRPALHSHMSRFHNNKKLPSCDTCHRVFVNSQALQSHIDALHSTNKRPGFLCGLLGCKKIYLRKRHLLVHLKIEHAENPVRFPGTLGKNEFKTRAEPKQDIPAHSTEKPFKCTKCGRSFAHRGAMKCHEKVHLEICTRELIKCQVCHGTFLSRADLQFHIRAAHENRKSYLCQVCDQRFATSSSMRRHVDLRHCEQGEDSFL